jgi:hypothetical protein
MATKAGRKSTGAESFARIMPIFIVVFFIGYAIVAYALLFIPKLGRLVSGGDLDMAPYAARLDETRAYDQQLQTLQSAYDAVTPDRRAGVEQMIPAGTDTQSLYAVFDSLAAQNGMVLISVSTALDSATMTQSGRQVVQVSINLAGGTYPALKTFLAALEHEQRIIDVQSIVFGKDSSDYAITADAYVFSPARLTTPPPAPIAAAAPSDQNTGQ